MNAIAGLHFLRRRPGGRTETMGLFRGGHRASACDHTWRKRVALVELAANHYYGNEFTACGWGVMLLPFVDGQGDGGAVADPGTWLPFDGLVMPNFSRAASMAAVTLSASMDPSSVNRAASSVIGPQRLRLHTAEQRLDLFIFLAR